MTSSVGPASPSSRRQQLKILHFSDNYPPVTGGLERAVKTLATAQATRGDRVGVVTTTHPDLPSFAVEDGVEVHRLPTTLQRVPKVYAQQGRVFMPPVADPLFARALKPVLAGFRPDVAHFHGWVLHSGLKPAQEHGAAVVMHAHDYGCACATMTLFREGDVCDGPGLARCTACSIRHYGAKGVPVTMALRASGRRTRGIDAWVALSSAVAAAGSAPRLTDRRAMTVVPSFVPDHVLAPSTGPRPSFVPPHGDYLFFAGQLSAHKGTATLFEAHQRLRERGHDIHLVVAGLVKSGAPRAPDHGAVTVASDVPHDDVMRAWSHATIGAVPSAWPEPFGQVAVECLAAGTPLVASDIGGLRDIVVHEESGLLVPPRDPEALADALQRLLLDRTLAARLAANGRARARRFSVSAVLPQIDAVYRAALSSSGSVVDHLDTQLSQPLSEDRPRPHVEVVR